MRRLFGPVVLLVMACGALTAQDVTPTYVARCAQCHGADGSGNTALGRRLKLHDLRSPQVKQLSALELATIIAKGTDHGRMPGFEKQLGSEMVAQLAAYVRSIETQPGVLQMQSTKLRTKPAAPDAKTIYAAKCAHCHGADGRGNTILGKRMEVRDMRSREIQERSDEQLATVIAYGTDRGRMPGFHKTLGLEAVEQLTSYVRGLMAGPSAVASDDSARQSVTAHTQVQHSPSSKMDADNRAETLWEQPVAAASGSHPVAPKLSSVTFPATRSPSPNALVDLNSASKETLMALPGITETDAVRIMNGRPYKSSLQFRTRNIIAPEKYARISQRVIAKQPARGARSSAEKQK